VTERDYAWTDEWDAFCIALVEHRTPAEVLRMVVRQPAIGPDRADRIRTWAESQDYQNYGTSIEATALGDWTLVVEMNGFQASIPGVMRRLSTHTRAVSLFRNVNAVMSFNWATNGALVRSFDPLLYHPQGSLGSPLPEESGLSFGVPGHVVSAAFACAERLTGVHLAQDLLGSRDAWLAIGHHPIISSKLEDWNINGSAMMVPSENDRP
jgi:hypothetical protein